MARLSPNAALTDVTRFFASYNLVCAPVVDDEDHLLGAVTVDDVLDHLLPDNWRDEGLDEDEPAPAARGGTLADHPPRRRLDQPRSGRRFTIDIDPETFGRFSESLARFMGTGTFLFWQTLLVIIWITLNMVGVGFGWDPYPFILLNLAFSTQAAYAAPLILLAQNRQDDRDRITLEEDRTGRRRPRRTPSSWPANWPPCGWPSARSRPATTCAANSSDCGWTWTRWPIRARRTSPPSAPDKRQRPAQGRRRPRRRPDGPRALADRVPTADSMPSDPTPRPTTETASRSGWSRTAVNSRWQATQRQQQRPRRMAGPLCRASTISWRWRELNPRPTLLREGFSGRSPLRPYSAPPVSRTRWCDRPSRCLLSLKIPRPDPSVILLADVRIRVGENPRSDGLLTRSGGEGEVVRLGVRHLIFLQRMVNEIIVAFLGPLHLTRQTLSKPITPEGENSPTSIPASRPGSIGLCRLSPSCPWTAGRRTARAPGRRPAWPSSAACRIPSCPGPGPVRP